jgi:predicted DNA binding CopG/RHH family protein
MDEDLKQFHNDPYDAMSDEEFEDEMVRSLRPVSTPVSIRLPAELLARTKRQAARRHLGYQTLIKRLISVGIARLERT